MQKANKQRGISHNYSSAVNSSAKHVHARRSRLTARAALRTMNEDMATYVPRKEYKD